MVERVEPRIASTKVPPEWQPQEYHRVNARLYGLDEPDGAWCFENILAMFRSTTFRTAHWDWNGRFDRWLLDEKVKRETSKHKDSQQGPPSPRRNGAFGGLQLQPDMGKTGFEGVTVHQLGDDDDDAKGAA